MSNFSNFTIENILLKELYYSDNVGTLYIYTHIYYIIMICCQLKLLAESLKIKIVLFA